MLQFLKTRRLFMDFKSTVLIYHNRRIFSLLGVHYNNDQLGKDFEVTLMINLNYKAEIVFR